MIKWLTLISFLLAASSHGADVFPGADERTPARSQYFSWINNTNEGATDAHTLTNLAFFDWLNQDFGMQLDIYAFDAGAIDGKRWYGSTDSDKFKAQFPNGFDPLYQRAKQMGVRLGIWGGPDGFGDTPEDARERINMMVRLCEKYQFELFKFDTVAGDLRDDKQTEFVEMMTRCRKFSPDLILLNHRINLGEQALPHATTFLWEGKETYTDVHMVNQQPALHHRAGALARGLPPKLSRLTEDHGVCLSSALDYWDDELVLQAFNRALILSPQIYCNPWLLADDEFPKLARIFNLARHYKDILPNATLLPESRYGEFAVARGDDNTRLITLRNLTWNTQKVTLRIDQQLGLTTPEDANTLFEVRRYHPSETILGKYRFGDEVVIEVDPFRASLIRVTNTPDFGLEGINYDVLHNTVLASGERKLSLRLWGEPGKRYDVGLRHSGDLRKAELNGRAYTFNGDKLSIQFDGPSVRPESNIDLPLQDHRSLGEMRSIDVPGDAQSLYESTVFSADNNALEVRSLQRSGPTRYPAVQKARDAFFEQPLFTERAIWDRNLFDGNHETAFAVMQRWPYWWNKDPDTTVHDGGFRLDLGQVEKLDSIVLHTRDEVSLQPAKLGEGVIAQVSADLKEWTEVRFLAGKRMHLEMPEVGFPMRYLRIESDAPRWLSEVEAYRNGRVLKPNGWRASNLFGAFERMNFTQAWQLDSTISHIQEDQFLAVAIAGDTGNESVYAALRVDGQLVGAPDRAPSYPANTWELQVAPVQGNYTYYIPLKPEWSNKPLEVVVLGTDSSKQARPEVWLSRKPKPTATKILTLRFE